MLRHITTQTPQPEFSCPTAFFGISIRPSLYAFVNADLIIRAFCISTALRAFSSCPLKIGIETATNTAIIATTINSSASVKPFYFGISYKIPPITQTNITSSLLQSFCLCLVLQKPFCSSLPFSWGRRLSSWMECL